MKIKTFREKIAEEKNLILISAEDFKKFETVYNSYAFSLNKMPRWEEKTETFLENLISEFQLFLEAEKQKREILNNLEIDIQNLKDNNFTIIANDN